MTKVPEDRGTASVRRLPWPRDATLGIVSGLLAVVYLGAAFQITPDPSPSNVLGPRVAPLTIGFAALACSLAIVVQAMRGGSRPAVEHPPPDGAGSTSAEDQSGSEGAGGRNLRRLVVMFVMFTGYILVFIPLGYLFSTFVFLVAMTTYVEPRKWVRNCVFAAVFAGVVYVLFTRGLQVQLPPGLFG